MSEGNRFAPLAGAGQVSCPAAPGKARGRRLKAVAAVAALAAVLSDPATAVTRYRATPLVASGAPVRALAINALGQVTGNGAFLYSNGVVQTITIPFCTGQAIDDNGRIAGYCYPAPHGIPPVPYVGYPDGKGKSCPLGSYGLLYGINAGGEIVGYAGRAFLASVASPCTVGVDLGTLGGAASAAYAINDRTEVTGWAQTAAGARHTFVWSAGAMRDLGTLGGTSSEGNAINATGQVTGCADTSGGSSHAYVYANGVMRDLGTLGGPNSCGRAINGRGAIVGDAQAINGQSRAFLHLDGSMHDLNALVVSGLGGEVLAQATGINDRGQIVANTCPVWFPSTGCSRFDLGSGYLLDPIDEPPRAVVPTLGPGALIATALLLLGSGLAFSRRAMRSRHPRRALQLDPPAIAARRGARRPACSHSAARVKARRRRWPVAAAAGALVAALAWPSEAATRYRAKPFPPLHPSIGSHAVAINDAGQVVGLPGFLDSGGATSSLTGWPRDISAGGQVVGFMRAVGDSNVRPFRYSAGVMSVAPWGNWGVANGINASGEVVGQAYASPTSPMRAYLATGGAFYGGIDLGTLGGAQSEAIAINDRSEVTGWADTAGGSRHAFLYAGGAMRDLGTLGGAGSVGSAINAAGHVTGFADTAGGRTHAFVYAGGAMRDLGTLGGPSSYGYGINDSGAVVGKADAVDGKPRAFVYVDGAMQDLNALTYGLGGAPLVVATDINGRGQIVANTCDPYPTDPSCRGYLLDPVEYVATASPVPALAPAALAATALLLLASGLRLRRRRDR